MSEVETNKSSENVTLPVNLSQELYYQVREVLADDPHITDIIPAREYDLSKTISLNWFKDISKLDRGKDSIIVLQELLCWPYVKDDFDNSFDRDNWKFRIYQKGEFVNDIVNINALRPAAFIIIRDTVSSLQRLAGVEHKSIWDLEFHYNADQILALASGDKIRAYRVLPKDSQVEYARIYKQKLADFLIHLNTPNNEESEWDLVPHLTDKTKIHPVFIQHVMGSLLSIRTIDKTEFRDELIKKQIFNYRNDLSIMVRSYVRDGFLDKGIFAVFNISENGKTIDPEEVGLNEIYRLIIGS
jgi:hypothetical protein